MGTGKVIGLFEELEELPELTDLSESGNGLETFRVQLVFDRVSFLQPEGKLRG